MKWVKYHNVYGQKCFKSLFITAEKFLLKIQILKEIYEETQDYDKRLGIESYICELVGFAKTIMSLIFKMGDQPLSKEEFAAWMWAYNIRKANLSMKNLQEDDDIDIELLEKTE